jgi:hypothetical protein
MSDRRVQKFREVLCEVNDLLYEEWAPIGLVGSLPRDEYETYAMRVVSMLADGASEIEIARYLVRTAEAITGQPASGENSESVAKQLIEFREAARGIAL